MQWRIVLLSLFLSACGLKKMLPEGPALDAAERAEFVEAPSGAAYSGEALTSFPVLPVVVFGAAYDLDLVIVSDHPEWNMHEYARLQTPAGPVWLAKDARESTMLQSFVADIPDIDNVLPEVPVERKGYPVEVNDRSTEDWIDLTLRYENIDGKPVEVTYEGKPPVSYQKKRNGNTMGHSPHLLAVLDLPYRTFGKRASITIDGEDVRISRILGLLPFRMALAQTQGGLATGQMRLEPPREEGLDLPESAFAVPGEVASANEPLAPSGPEFESVHHLPSGAYVRRAWQVEQEGEFVEARQVSELRTLIYRFRVGERGTRELVSARVEQYGRDEAPTHIVFSPALPDLGHRFHGTVRSRYAIDINGQLGHAMGEVVSTWGEDGPVVEVLPGAPWWTTDRPLRASFSLEDGGVDVDVVVSDAP